MSFDIDIENYGRNNAPVAGEQDIQHFEVGDDPLDMPSPVEQVETQEIANPQAENFRALRAEIERIKSEREQEKVDYQAQIQMLRANMQRQPEPQPKKMFEGMDDNDVPSVAEIRSEWANREAEYQAKLEELQVQSQYSDYKDVIENYSLPLIKQKPYLLQGIQNSSNKALMAYELGKMAQQINMNSQAPSVNKDAQRMVENARKPKSLAQAGGQSVLSKADYFASMSDAEFMKYASKNLEGI